MVDFGLDRTALLALKGNVTFHENVKIYEHDYKYMEFKNVLVKIKEEGLIITYKDNGQLVDYCYDYSKLWRIESSDKVENLEFKESVLIILGKDSLLKQDQEKILKRLNKQYPSLKVDFLEGKQDIYSYIVAVC